MSRSGEHYMPRPDGDFAAWANQYDEAVHKFYEAVHKFYEAQGLDVSELKPLEEAVAGWNTDYPAHVAAQQRAEGARAAKDAARAALERAIRPVTNFVQGYPKTTDHDRATIGITVRAPHTSKTPAPTTRPMMAVRDGGRLTHTLRLVDEAAPTARGRPRGVARAEVFVALTPAASPAPPDPATYRYIGSVTAGSTTLSFEPNKGGMQAHYVSRWVNTRGASGPWSETASATVAA